MPEGTEDPKVDLESLQAQIEALTKESRKYHDRAQAAESKLEKAAAATAAAEEERLKEQQKFQELYENEKAAHAQSLSELKPLAEQWTGYRETRRAQLLEQLGDKAERYGSVTDLTVLEQLVADLTTKPNVPGEPGKPGVSPHGEFGGYGSLRELALAAARGVPGARERYDALRGGGA